MPALFVFLLKVNLALIVFCLGYYLVLRKLTFYTLNRFYLVLAIIFSSVYPAIHVDDFVQGHKLTAPLEQAVLQLKAPAEKLLTYSWYWNWASLIFWIGASIFAMRLVVQFISLYRIYRRSEPGVVQQHKVRITDDNISPFSFWRSIFINPDNIEAANLSNILQHEQIHVSQLHTLDILLAEVSVIFYWFNPGVWLMKKAISENIEFITDRKILQQGTDSKAYQYSLLNVSLGVNTSLNITSHFNFSTLKNRIRMMNARRSAKINLSRYALLVPTVIICLCICSISKANVVDSSKAAYESVTEMIGRPLAEVVIRSKRIAHKLPLHVTDTTAKATKPIVIYLTPHVEKTQFTFVANAKYSFVAKADTTIKLKGTVNEPVEKVVVLKPDTASNKATFSYVIVSDTSKQIKGVRITGKTISVDDPKKASPASTEKIKAVRLKKSAVDTSKNQIIEIRSKQ